jgi:hypothetical protein
VRVLGERKEEMMDIRSTDGSLQPSVCEAIRVGLDRAAR